MTLKTVSPIALYLAVLGATLTVFWAAPLAGAEVAATHLVYDSAVKMKKADASLFLPFLDQSKKTDTLTRRRQVACSVFAEGRNGSLRVKGRLRLRLLGETANGVKRWESPTLLGSLDASGETSFEPDDIGELVDQATAAGAGIELFEVDFDGAGGSKVATLTMDCVQR